MASPPSHVQALLPDPSCLKLNSVEHQDGGRVLIAAAACGSFAYCPACHHASHSLHSWRPLLLCAPWLDLRWLDFTARPVPVVEADGTVVIEGATESLDRMICEIPEEKTFQVVAAVPKRRASNFSEGGAEWVPDASANIGKNPAPSDGATQVLDN